jgi:hypothetical protein
MALESARRSPKTRKVQLRASTVTFEMPVVLIAELASDVRHAGRAINVNERHRANTPGSIKLSFDPGSKVNDDSDTQYAKQPSQRLTTDAGMQTDFNDEQ